MAGTSTPYWSHGIMHWAIQTFVGTMSGIVLGIWDYIRAMGLQEDEEKRLVRCDHRLRSVPPLPIPIPI